MLACKVVYGLGNLDQFPIPSVLPLTLLVVV